MRESNRRCLLCVVTLACCFLPFGAANERSEITTQTNLKPVASPAPAAPADNVWILTVENGTGNTVVVFENGNKIGNVNRRDERFRIRQKPRQNVVIEIFSQQGRPLARRTFFDNPGEATIRVR